MTSLNSKQIVLLRQLIMQGCPIEITEGHFLQIQSSRAVSHPDIEELRSFGKFLRHIQRSSVIGKKKTLDKGRSTGTVKLLLESERGKISTSRILVDHQIKMTK